MEQTITIDGLDELTEALENAIKKYPDKAGDLLRLNARRFRKVVVSETKRLTKSKGTSKRSLAKVGSYKVSKVYGVGLSQAVDISTKSPHFHLVEHGHLQKNKKGEVIGFVQGRHQFDSAIKKHNREFHDRAEKMIEELLREEDLL